MPQRDDPPVISITSLRSGRNGTDPPEYLSAQQCSAAFNIDWSRSTVGAKRNGSDPVALTGGTAFSGRIAFLSRHIPGSTERDMELWGADDQATPIMKYLAGGTTWANVTLVDAISNGFTSAVSSVTFNGKHWVAYKSAVDRLHTSDVGAYTLRRAGVAAVVTAPTHAVAGGAVTATRTYIVMFTTQSGGVTIRRSNASATSTAQALVAQQDTLTRPTAPGDSETHWELYAADTDGVYWRIATTALATTTVIDNNVTLSAVTGIVIPQPGINTPFPSVKYLATDNNRLFGAGAWETGQPTSRVWFSPVLGDNDVGDDERYVNSTTRKTYVDLNEKDGGAITGISQPINGVLYVFKYSHIWKLVPTGDPDAPYLPYRISSMVGCVSHHSITLGEDVAGRPAVYFASNHGPYRLGPAGLEYLGEDLEDFWGSTDTTIAVNFSTTDGNNPCFAVWHPTRHQYWLWVAVGSSTDMNRILVFDRRRGVQVQEGNVRGGWSIYTGNVADARCACLFSSTLGASMSTDLRPYLGRNANNNLYKADSTNLQDNATSYRAYFVTKAYSPAGFGHKFSIEDGVMTAMAGAGSSGATITIKAIPDYGGNPLTPVSKSANVLYTEYTPPTRQEKRVEGMRLAGLRTVQFEIGDASALLSAWAIDSITIPYIIDQQG